MKLVTDTWLLFQRGMLITLRNPVWVIIGLFQPICYLLLFGPLLEGLAGAPGFPKENALTVFVPGLLVMLTIFSTVFVGFALIAELREGVIERMRVTAVSRLALPMANALRDVVILLVQSTLLLLFALPMGLKADLGGVILLLALSTLIGLMMASTSYALALTFKDENAFASTTNFFAVPLLLLSGIMLPMSLAPEWLRTVASFNPFSHVVDAARALIAGNLGHSSVLTAFVIVGILTVLALYWSVNCFKRATA